MCVCVCVCTVSILKIQQDESDQFISGDVAFDIDVTVSLITAV